MRRLVRQSLLFGLAVVGMVLCATAARAVEISVNFGSSSPSGTTPAGALMLSTDLAGVVHVGNWNNATTSDGSTTTSLDTIPALVNSGGAATTASVKWNAGSASNAPNLITGTAGTNAAPTGDGKMMMTYWNTNNSHTSQSWPSGTGSASYRGLDAGGFGPRNNTVTFTNLNAVFTTGYDVYVYVSGASAGDNEGTGTNAAVAAKMNFGNPMQVIIGNGNAGVNGSMNTAIDGFGVTPSWQNGADNPAADGTSHSTKSVEVDANLAPWSAQRATIWPVTQIIDGISRSNGFGGPSHTYYYSSRFDGTYTDGSNWGATDNIPMDFLPLTGSGATVGSVPPGDYPDIGPIAAVDWQEPGVRGIALGNYVKLSGLSFDTLDILARNIYGMRRVGSSGTSEIETGGILGIQLVSAQVTEVVPEPSTVILSLTGLIGLSVLAWRRRRG